MAGMLNVTIELPEPGAGIGLTPKLTVVPDGTPEADSEIAELNPPLTVVLKVTVPGKVCATLIDDGAAERVKFGCAGAVSTVSVTVVVLVIPPPVAVTVIG